MHTKKLLASALAPVLVAVVSLSSLVACAALVGEDFHAREVKKIARLSGARLDEFALLNGACHRCGVEADALRMIIEDKDRQVRACTAELERRYGISPVHNYHYEATNLTVYLVLPSTDGSSVQLRPHRAFASTDEAKGMLDIIAMRDTARRHIEVLGVILGEREAAEKRAQALLAQKFDVKADGKYAIEADTGDLYEILPPPPSKAEKRAADEKARAERKAKEEAEAKARAEKKAAEKAAEKTAHAKKHADQT